jgi:hypothetical protein
MSARKPASSSLARARFADAEAQHDQGLADLMRLTDYLGDARRAALALVERHGSALALEFVDRMIAECGENDSAHAVEMGAMWMMIRSHIADGVIAGSEPQGDPP